MPFDKYVVSSCAMTEELLANDRPQQWPVYMLNSYVEPGKSFPFGYLAPASNRTQVNLIVMGYNFITLSGILESHAIGYGTTPDSPWLKDIHKFLHYTPFYYHKAIAHALQRMNVPGLDPNDYCYTTSEAINDIRLSVAMAREEFGRRGFYKLLAPTNGDAHQPPQQQKVSLCSDVMRIPREKLLETLHLQKYYFFQAGRVDDINQIIQGTDPLVSI